MNTNLYNFTVATEGLDSEKNSYSGFVTAASYTGAMQRLTDYFGEDDIVKVQIEYVTDSDLVIVPENYLEPITKYNYC